MPEQEQQAQKFLATSDEYAQFLQSNVWRDLEGALRRRIESYDKEAFERLLKSYREGGILTFDGVPLYQIQGATQELRFLLVLPKTTQAVLAKQEEVDRRKAETKPKET